MTMTTSSIFRRTKTWLATCASMLAANCAIAGPTFQFGDEGSMTLTYAVQAWATLQNFSAPGVDDNNDLYLRRHRLALSGQVNDYVGYYVQAEAGGNPNADRRTYFRDAYMTLDYNDSLRFIAGRFKNTFSRENLEACLEPLTLDRSEMLAYTPFGGTRDDGVAVWGNLLDAKLQYRFMVGKGREFSDYTPSKKSRYTARVHYSFLDPEFNYGYLGTYLGTAKVFTIGAAYDQQDKVVYADYPMHAGARDYKAWTVDAFFEYPATSGVYTVSGAYFQYDSDDVTNRTPDPKFPISGDLKGHYIKAGYMFPEKVGPGRLQFFARQDVGDYGVKTVSTEYYDRKLNSIGANYYLDGQKLKLSAEYTDVKFDMPHPRTVSLQNYSQFTIGLQFIY